MLQKTISKFKENHLFWGVSFTVTRYNFLPVVNEGSLRDYIDLGCKIFFFVEYVPVSEGTEGLIMAPPQRRKMIEIITRIRSCLPGLFGMFPGDEDEYDAPEQSFAAGSFEEIDGPVDNQSYEEQFDGNNPPIIDSQSAEIVGVVNPMPELGLRRALLEEMAEAGLGGFIPKYCLPECQERCIRIAFANLTKHLLCPGVKLQNLHSFSSDCAL